MEPVRLLLCAVLWGATFAASVEAGASDWVSVGKINDGTQETFVDTSSIRIAGDLRRAWLKIVPAPHTLTGVAGGPNKWVDHDLRREAFRCRDEYHRREAQMSFFDDGTSYTLPSKLLAASWDPVPPDTAASVVMRFICNWAPPAPEPHSPAH
jgi:hypothetical protein